MPYELWKFLHLASYAVLLLGFGHQFANGQQLFRPGRRATTGSVSTWRCSPCLVWGRLVAPLLLNLRHRLGSPTWWHEGPDIISIYLSGRRPDRDGRGRTVLPLAVPAPRLGWQAHPFSLSAAAATAAGCG